jgi:hypothetical protein
VLDLAELQRCGLSLNAIASRRRAAAVQTAAQDGPRRHGHHPRLRRPEQRLVVEADGAQWHEHELAREDDAERQARLEAHGERVIRVTWKQAVARPQETLARIRAAGAALRDPEEGESSQ